MLKWQRLKAKSRLMRWWYGKKMCSVDNTMFIYHQTIWNVSDAYNHVGHVTTGDDLEKRSSHHSNLVCTIYQAPI
jgi:hypothetical protein